MKYKAIIFDMDGTIITTENLYKKAEIHLLKTKTNLTQKECEDFLATFKGSSLYYSCSVIKETFNLKESIEELIAEKEAFVFNSASKHITLIDGFETFHQKSSSLNLKSAIATNATQSSLDEVLKHIPLAQFFKEHIYCIDHIGKKAKPEPDIFLYAAKKINTDPKHCIVIEDSAPGITAAKAAGMFCIGINSGNDRETLIQADIIIDHYDEIELEKLLND